MQQNFWKNKKVLVTGHTGFKGSWLCQWLIMMGAQVTGIGLEPETSPSMYHALGYHNVLDSRIMDIRNYELVQQVFREKQPEIVFHLAAQPIVRTSYEQPILTYETNVMGTVSVLDAVRHCEKVKAVVNVTTDKVYENQEWCWGYRENDRLNGYDPYSNSKSCSELVTSSYVKSYFNPEDYKKNHTTAVATARAGNVIGGGDWAKDRIVPDCIRAIEKQTPVVLRNPGAIRPWQHVLEPLNGYLTLAEKLYEEGVDYNGAYNFGPDSTDVIPVKELVQKLMKYYNKRTEIQIQESGLHEANTLKLDCAKAKNILKWKPLMDVDAALQLTAQWYAACHQEKMVTEYTQKQIALYLNGAENENK